MGTRPSPLDSSPPTDVGRPSPTLLPYVIGNGGALLVGLVVCFGGLALEGAFVAKGWDFFYYYAVSRLVVLGHGAQLYDLHALGQVERALASPYRVPQGVIPNVYAPFLALVLSPLSLLPYDTAYFVWMAVNCVLLVVALYVLEQFARLGDRGGRLLRFAVMCSLPVLIALLQGQTSVLDLLLLTAVFLALRNGQEKLAGACLALTLFKPQYMPAFLLVLAVRGHWRALTSFAVSAGALLAVPALVLGPRTVPAYAHSLWEATARTDRGFGVQWNRGFDGLVQPLFPRPVATVLTILFAVLALILLARCARRCRSLDLPFALAVVVSLLISPHVLIHDLTMLALPAAVALRYRTAGPPSLPAVLVTGYLAVTVGFGLTFAVPLQLAPLAMSALGWWLYITERPGSREPASPPAALPVRAGDSLLS